MRVNIAHPIENKELSTQCYRTDNSVAKKTTEKKGNTCIKFLFHLFTHNHCHNTYWFHSEFPHV